jgi:hypothetical protein
MHYLIVSLKKRDIECDYLIEKCGYSRHQDEMLETDAEPCDTVLEVYRKITLDSVKGQQSIGQMNNTAT